MFRKTLIGTAIALALAAVASARSDGHTATVTATVTKIDSANRVLTLKGPEGNVIDVEVSTAVKRFPEIKVGDKIVVTYGEAVVINVSKADASLPLSTSVERSLAPQNTERPSGVAKRTIKAVVGVDSIDTAKQEVTVHTADGSTATFHIKDPKKAEGVKAGDKIMLLYEEAVAVEVKNP